MKSLPAMHSHHLVIPLDISSLDRELVRGTGTMKSALLTAWRGPLAVLALCAMLMSATAQAQEAKSAPGAIRLFRSGVSFQNDGKFDLAAADYQELLKKYPTDPLVDSANHYLGVCLNQLKKYGEAITALQTVVTKSPKFKYLDATYFHLGKAQIATKKFAAAAASFDAVVTKFPKSNLLQPALYEKGEAYYNAKKPADAVKAYAEFVEKFPKHPLYADALYALGVTQQELGKNKEADAAFAKFLETHAKHRYATEVGMRRGSALYAMGNFAEAEKLFAVAAAVEGFQFADYATIRHGEAMFAQKKYTEAAPVFLAVGTKFGKDSPYVVGANLSAGKCFYLTNQGDPAVKALTQVLPAGGIQAAEAAHWIAKVHLKAGKPDAALKVVEPVLPKAGDSPFLISLMMDKADAVHDLPNRRKESIPLFLAVFAKDAKHQLASQALYNAAFAAQAVEDYAQALELAAKFIEAYPGNSFEADVLNVQAESYLQTDKYAEAEKAFSSLLEKHAKNSNAGMWAVRCGLAMSLQGKHAETIAMLAPTVAKIKDKDSLAEVQHLLGSSYYGQKKYKEAAAALAASLAAQPKWRQADETLLLLSRAQRAAGDVKGAVASIKKFVTDFPASKMLDRARYRLAEYSYLTDDFKTASTEYQAVIDSGKSEILAPYCLRGLGLTELAQKKYDTADKAFTTLIAAHPKHRITPRCHLYRAQAREQLKNYAGAVADATAFLETATEAADKSTARHVLGVCQDRVKKHDEAAKTFAALLKDDPKYADAASVLYEWAWSLKTAKKNAEAVAIFGRLAAEHPNDARAAEGLYHLGEQLYSEASAGKKDKKEGWKALYGKAAEQYAKAQAKKEQGTLGENIRYKLGWSNYQQEKFDDAQKAFAGQLAAFASGKLAADALFMIGECLFKQGDYKMAQPALEKSLAKPPANKVFQQLAALHAGQSATKNGVHAAAVNILEKAATDFPKSELLSEILYETAWAKHNLAQAKPNQLDEKQLNEAVALYEKVVDADLGEAGAKAQFMIGQVQFLRKQFKDATRSFNRVASAFGKNKMQADALFELARCYEVTKQVGSAKDAYQKLLKQFPDSQRAAAAKTALARLK